MQFNTQSTGTRTVNLAGGKAYTVSPKFELVSILLTSFLQNQFYRSKEDTLSTLLPLIAKDPLFAAKAAIYARREYGMRSITHVVGGEIAKLVKGETWTRKFFAQLFKRPDDMLEVVAYYTGKYGKRPLPNALKDSIRTALSGLGEYALAKYRGEGKEIKMVDLVNLTHPKATPALTKLIKGELKSTGTWETKLTQAGQKAEGEEDKAEMKSAAWMDLLSSKKLGYLAALRNVRNICKQAPEAVPMLCELLTNAEHIKKALIFPFQFQTAIEEVKTDVPRPVLIALAQALELSVENCPVFDGKTLVAVDVSGSMQSENVMNTAALFGAVMWKRNDSAMVLYNDRLGIAQGLPVDSVSSIAAGIASKCRGGTNLALVFNWMLTAPESFDRIVLLSDMQSWQHDRSMPSYLTQYRQRRGKDPFVYSLDLAGHGTALFPESKVFCLAGFSPEIFEVMRMLETDRQALIKTIEGQFI